MYGRSYGRNNRPGQGRPGGRNREVGVLEINAVGTEFLSPARVTYPECQPEMVLRAEAYKHRLSLCASPIANEQLEGHRG